MTGTTDTAVGEVGASMSIYGDFDNNMVAGGTGFTSNSAGVAMDYAWGWWKMTPELTFAGGYNGSLATIGMGIRKINDAYISRGSVGVDGGDFTQMRLSYASGPIGIAVALEIRTKVTTETLARRLTCLLIPVARSALLLKPPIRVTCSMPNSLASCVTPTTTASLPGGKVTQSQIGLGLGAKLSDMFDMSVAGSIGNNVWFGDGVSYRWLITGGVGQQLRTSATAGKSAALLWRHCLTRSAPNWVPASRATRTTFLRWKPIEQQLPVASTGRRCLSSRWAFRPAGLISTTHDAHGAPLNYQDVTDTRAAFVTWWNF